MLKTRKGKWMRYLIIGLIFMQTLFALDIVVDINETKKSELEVNLGQPYFGEKLFKGHFQGSKQFQYNPNYIVNVDDKLSVKMWGAHSYNDDNLTVDKQGNVFIPEVGAVHLLGLEASKVQNVIEQSVESVFNKNVHVYADIKQYQAISVFISGPVKNAGLYNGLSTDSILQFIDKAGGILRGEGSYRNIEVLRNNMVVQTIDLYDFLLTGNISSFQFKTSDVILVKPVESFISVLGDVKRPYFFELPNQTSSVAEVMQHILPSPATNSFIVTTWTNRKEITKEHSLEEAASVFVKKGDKLRFVSNYYAQNIEVTIEGEHKGINFISVPKGTTLYDVLKQVKFTDLSDIKSVHFYRKKVATMQQKLLNIKLQALESKVLTRDSTSKEEAEIYSSESAQVLEFIKRAKAVKQKGQVVLRLKNNLKKIVLEDGDRISIPKKSNIVVVQGEVSVPAALSFENEMTFEEYIEFCGGYSENADEDKVLLIKANGRVLKSGNYSFGKSKMRVEAGDSILVLKKVETKNMLYFKDITQILYQIAIGAAVVLQF